MTGHQMTGMAEQSFAILGGNARCAQTASN
jgi:hypothetical protein